MGNFIAGMGVPEEPKDDRSEAGIIETSYSSTTKQTKRVGIFGTSVTTMEKEVRQTSKHVNK